MKSYAEKLEAFRVLLERQTTERQKRLYPNLPPVKFGVENGYKFDKVFENTSAGQRLGRYMVENRTGHIFGIKSWTQVNKRRQYGSVDTIDQFDWSEYYGRALAGTKAEVEHITREESIKATHKRRGRKPKAAKLTPKVITPKIGK